VGRRFPAGRVLVRLRTADGHARTDREVLGDLLRGLGVTGALPDDRYELAALLRESTTGNAVLLILDDAAGEAQVRSLLPGTGDATVLITSRRHLGGLESARNLTVAPMPDTDALALLGRIVGASRVAAEPDAASRLVAVCAGMPLAVRIVGAKLTALSHLTLVRYADRFGDEGEFLTELVAGDLQVGSRLAVAYQDLAVDDQAVLRCLAAVADGTGTARELADTLGTDVASAERALERLVEAHLARVQHAEVEVHAAGNRACYALDPLMRRYVCERLARRGRPAADPPGGGTAGPDVAMLVTS